MNGEMGKLYKTVKYSWIIRDWHIREVTRINRTSMWWQGLLPLVQVKLTKVQWIRGKDTGDMKAVVGCCNKVNVFMHQDVRKWL